MRNNVRPGAIAGFLIALCLSTAFGLFLADREVTDPFLYYDVAFVARTQRNRRMVFPETGPFASLQFVPGRTILMVQLATMTGLAPEVLQYLPWGAMLVSQTLYVLALKLLKSPMGAGMVTLYLTLNLSHAAALYSLFAYAIVVPNYLGLIILSARLFQRDRNAAMLLALLFFAAAQVTHYTMTAWMVLFMIGASATISLQNHKAQEKSRVTQVPAPYLAMAFAVIYLAFNQAVYASFLPVISLETLEGAAQRFSSYLSLAPPLPAPYGYRRPASISRISTVTLLVILVPAWAGLLRDGWQLLVRRALRSPSAPWRPLIWGIAAAGIADAAAYTVRGVISTKSFSMFFPLVALIYARRRGKKLVCLAAATLLGLTLIKVGLFYHGASVIARDPLKLTVAQVRPSARWLSEHVAKPDYTMLADLNLYGKYLLAAAESAGSPTPSPVLQGYTEDAFAWVIGAPITMPAPVPDIAALDTISGEPVTGFVWRQYRPLGAHQTAIRNNRRLHVIYDDGGVWLAAPAGD
jgi:hypothetical protein